MVTSLEDVFSNEEKVESEAAPTAPEVTEAEEVAEEQPVESAQPEPSKEEVKEEDSKAEDTKKDKEPWHLAAVKDERRKRQELEKRLAELEKKELPNVFEDQEQFVSALKSDFNNQLANVKLELSQSMMRQMHDDYDEMESYFVKVAADNPLLRDEAMKAENPAMFAYEQAKKHKQFEEMQDIDAYKEKLKAEIRAEIEQSIKADQEQKREKAGNLSPSLAKAKAAAKDAPVDESLGSIFGR